jgi:hypothetical protein
MNVLESNSTPAPDKVAPGMVAQILNLSRMSSFMTNGAPLSKGRRRLEC